MPGTLLLAAAVLLIGTARADEVTMNAEIDYLLDTVGESRCVFIRNGKEHAASAARDHLRTKRRRGRRHFDSADEFIERLASRSSLSGREYMIRCGDELVTSNAWFTAALERYRESAEADL